MCFLYARGRFPYSVPMFCRELPRPSGNTVAPQSAVEPGSSPTEGRSLAQFHGALYECTTGNREGWLPITDGYVQIDIMHTETYLTHPFSMRTSSLNGRFFQFDVVAETRSRRTKATFLQWHLKGSKRNFGVQV